MNMCMNVFKKLMDACVYFVDFLIPKSTTKEHFDETILDNYKKSSKRSLQCKDCAPHGLNKDTGAFYFPHCVRDCEPSHFPGEKLKDWKKRGQKEGVLTCQPGVKGRPRRKLKDGC